MKKTQSPFVKFVLTHRVSLIFAAIVLLAAIFRLFQLASLPPGLHPDEAANGLDVFKIIQNGDLRLIYNTNGPRESLFFFLQAFFVAVFGNTILALRIAPALLGVGAVVMLYLFVREWFGRRTALFAAFLMAVNPWVVTVSRDGFRASMVPIVIATVGYFAARAYATKKWYFFALSGFFMGLGLYTYTAFGVFLLVPVFGLAFMYFRKKAWLTQNWKNLAISAAVFAATVLPLAIVVALSPSTTTARVGGVSVFSSGGGIAALAESTTKTLLQFNYAGDGNNRHNLAGEPLLNTFLGIMLILGVLVAGSRFGRLKYACILAMFFVMLLPAILTSEGLPHGLRSIGSSIGAFTLAAIGISYLLSLWYKTFPINKPARLAGTLTISLLLLLTAIQGYRQYFVAWAQDPATYDAYNENFVQMAYFLNSGSKGKTNFVVADSYNTMIVEYLTNKKADFRLVDTNGLREVPLSDGVKQFVFPANDTTGQIIDILKIKYPGGTLTPHYSGFNEELLFYSYEVQ